MIWRRGILHTQLERRPFKNIEDDVKRLQNGTSCGELKAYVKKVEDLLEEYFEI